MRAALALSLFLLTSCATAPQVVEAVVADRLFCGLTIPDGGTVSQAEWDAFMSEVVTPLFPDGLTVWRAEGQWRGRDGTVVREPVMIIEVLHPYDAVFDRRMEEIADEYRTRFRQEAVMRVTMPARMDFVD